MKKLRRHLQNLLPLWKLRQIRLKRSEIINVLNIAEKTLSRSGGHTLVFGKLFQIVIGYYTAVPKDIAALSLYIIYIHRAGNKPSKVWPTYPLSTLEAKYKFELCFIIEISGRVEPF